MCLQAMKSLYDRDDEPVVVGLARMEQEWPGIGLAGMGPNKISRSMP